MKIFDILRKIRKDFSPYENSIEVLIFKDNLLHNLNEYINKFPDFSFAPVLKSNAYGHGLLEIAKILDKEKVPFFVVDSLYEARLLKAKNIKKDILIIGYTRLENLSRFNSSQFIFTIVSLAELKRLSENFSKSKKLRIHIKIDTGMHRQGVLIDEIDEAIGILKNNKNLNLEGICSHLADADSEEKSFTQSQIENWKKVVNKFKNNFSDIKYFHTSATAGTFYNQKDFGNVIRLGIGLYGINNSPFLDMNLKPAMRVESVVSTIRNLKKGESVGYNHTHTLDRDSKVATVPMGYFEGIDRRLSNIGSFKIGEKYCDILGRVSMNMSSVDVTELPDLNLDDKVIVLSEILDDKNSVVNLAKLANTIPYDILVNIMPHLKRRIIGNYEK